MNRAQTQDGLKPGLYLVATPIGNLGDMTARALDVLKGSDLIACEDTRVTAKLLSHYGIGAPTTSYHDHNADEKRPELIAKLKSGARVALVSDAGTPLISDPGYKLVRAAYEEGIYVTTIPGASSVLAALQLSALPSNQFAFLGFLPPKDGARRTFLAPYASLPLTLICFETAPRLIDSLAVIGEVMGERDIAVVREITKFFEETRRGTPNDLIAHYQTNGEPKGEIVLVIAPSSGRNFTDEEIDALLKDALSQESIRDASARIAGDTGLSKSMLYQRALQLKNGKG